MVSALKTRCDDEKKTELAENLHSAQSIELKRKEWSGRQDLNLTGAGTGVDKRDDECPPR